MPKLSYRLTAEDLIAAGRAHYRNSLVRLVAASTPRAWLFRISAGVVLLLLIFDIAFNADWSSGPNGLYAALGAAALVSIFALNHYVIIPRAARRVLAQQRAIQDEIEADWDVARSRWRSANWTSELDWKDYRCVLVRDGMAMLYQTDQMYQIVPARAFPSDVVRAEMLGHLEAAGVRREGDRPRR